jgi:arsenate reductase
VITIYHNPKCSNSRAALEILRSGGQVPRVVEYLKHPPTREDLKDLVAKLAVPVRQIVRDKEPLFEELGLHGASEERLLDAVAENPILLNRPIVVSDKGARLCRPPELVKSLL